MFGETVCWIGINNQPERAQIVPHNMLAKVIFGLIVLSLTASAANLLPPRLWLIELSRNLSNYYLLLHLVSLPVLLWLRRRAAKKWTAPAALMLCAFSFYYVQQLLPFYRAPKVTAGALDSPKFKMLFANLSLESQSKPEFKNLIARHQPDLVALSEIDSSWSEALGLKAQYPFYHEILRSDRYGLALYSKFPIAEPPRENIGDTLPPVIITSLEVKAQKNIEIVLLHAALPENRLAFLDNALTLRRLTSRYKHHHGDLIVAGGFNVTPFSSFYQALLYQAKLQDAMYGHGFKRTWNAQNWFQRLTLDHVLYRGGLRVSSAKLLPACGLDHFPLLVEFGAG